MIKELSYESVDLAVNSFAEKKAMFLGLNLDPLAPCLYAVKQLFK